MPWEQVIKFPTLLREVSFSAEQITNEMQGVVVSGSLIWSPDTKEDGPFKLYRTFGEEL